MNTALLDPLRHLKHKVKKYLGRIWLRRASGSLSPTHVKRMRQGLGIQLSENEILTIAHRIRAFGSARLLVFGTGHDSEFWHRVNRQGVTVFLEDDHDWVKRAKLVLPSLNIKPISYGTVRSDWQRLLTDVNALSEGLDEIGGQGEWDLILVDGPRGYEDTDPGRMQSIYFASRLIARGGDVFVHDCDRLVEQTYCDKFMSEFTLVNSVGRLRQYRFTGKGS